MSDVGQTSEQGGIPTNLRLLMILEQMASAGVPVPPTEVNEVLGLPKPTIHRQAVIGHTVITAHSDGARPDTETVGRKDR